MIQFGTRLKILDNSGVKIVKCIKLLKSKSKSTIGDKIIISTKKVKSQSKIKKGEVLSAIIYRLKKKRIKFNGISIKHRSNGALLLNKKNVAAGNRIRGSIAKELKYIFQKSLPLNLKLF
uniref:Ribosomal protein L14 n=1 Tax=Cyanophora paradoxa TaxID=2762 RepID=E9P1D8_CYAPA|nr:ribosomal protein L14 [Cyanophora paradoxa]ADW79190.1 ribosomal protein L14 [Cyanophora paradoxa]